MKIIKEDYLKTVRRPYPPLFISLMWSGFRNKDNFRLYLNEDFCIKYTIKSKDIFYYYKKEFIESIEIVYNEWQNTKTFTKAKQAFLKQENRLIQATQKDILTFIKEYEAYMPALILAWAVEDKIIEKLSSKLAKDLVDKINSPLQNNFYKQEEYDLVQTKDLKSHVEEYAWINSRYGQINPYTVEQAQFKLKNINKEKYLQTYKQEKEVIKQAIQKAKDLLGSEDYLVDILQFIVYYRTQRTDIMNKAGYLVAPILKSLAKEKNLTYEQILYCTKEEILGKLPDVETIRQRTTKHTAVMYKGEIKILINQAADEVDQLLQDNVLDIKELKGAIACQGLVRGKAKLILNRNDFKKIETGDILVTFMTTPEMMIIMKRASAFVTDEGGITCHAAIIARELKKPCIIGTKIGTQLIKDNDLLEVDANQGIIRKI